MWIDNRGVGNCHFQSSKAYKNWCDQKHCMGFGHCFVLEKFQKEVKGNCPKGGLIIKSGEWILLIEEESDDFR